MNATAIRDAIEDVAKRSTNVGRRQRADGSVDQKNQTDLLIIPRQQEGRTQLLKQALSIRQQMEQINLRRRRTELQRELLPASRTSVRSDAGVSLNRHDGDPYAAETS